MKKENLSGNNVWAKHCAKHLCRRHAWRDSGIALTRWHSHLRKWNAPRVCDRAELAISTSGETESLFLPLPGFSWSPLLAPQSKTNTGHLAV